MRAGSGHQGEAGWDVEQRGVGKGWHMRESPSIRFNGTS